MDCSGFEGSPSYYEVRLHLTSAASDTSENWTGNIIGKLYWFATFQLLGTYTALELPIKYKLFFNFPKARIK